MSKMNLFRKLNITNLLEGTKVLSKLKCKRYNINILTSKNYIIVSYKGPKFSIDDLKETVIPEDYLGGNGKKILNSSEIIKYKYINGVNYWIINVKMNYRVKTKRIYIIENNPLKYFIVISSELGGTIREEYLQLVNEILMNILMNTNITNEEKILEEYRN